MLITYMLRNSTQKYLSAVKSFNIYCIRMESSVIKSQKRELENPVSPTPKKIKEDKRGPTTAEPDMAENKNTASGETQSVISSSEFSQKSKKLAVLLSYSGKDYYGMQKNQGVKTVEGDLLNAMLKANIIPKEFVEKPQLMGFQRASRTDKGVSAVRQVISLKLPPVSDLVEKINKHLPPVVRIVGWKRATKKFDSKCSCTARTYSYMLPTFAFTPLTETTTEDYRIPHDVINNVNKLLSVYEGTHNFHNYTSQKKPNDPSCSRYIMSCKCGLPFVVDGMEFAIIEVKGQSFMLHQIRKMIGLAIAISRGLAPRTIMTRAWGPDRLDIPKAPGLGLMLEGVHYEQYNERYGADGLHEPLTWEEYNDFLNEFKKKHILPTIVETEKSEKSMLSWLETLPFHTFDIRDSSPNVCRHLPLLCAFERAEESNEGKELDDAKACKEEVTKIIEVAAESNIKL